MPGLRTIRNPARSATSNPKILSQRLWGIALGNAPGVVPASPVAGPHESLAALIVTCAVFDTEAWMITRQRNPKPNEGEKGIGQPVHPAQTLFCASIGKQEIHPYIEDL